MILGMLLLIVINVQQATMSLQVDHQLFAVDVQHLCLIAYSALLTLHAIYARLAILQERVMAASQGISQQTIPH